MNQSVKLYPFYGNLLYLPLSTHLFSNSTFQVKAVNEYESTGHLFTEVSRQQLTPTVMQRFWEELYSVLKEIARLVNTRIDELLESAMKSMTFLKDWQQISCLSTSET